MMTPDRVVEINCEENRNSQSPDMKAGDKQKESTLSTMYQQVCASNKKWELATEWIQWSSLVSLTGLLIAILVINKLRKSEIWEVELWRTCVFVMVIFCGNIVSRRLKDGIKFLLENINHYLKSDFVYLIYVIINSSTIFIWLSLIMVVWLVLIRGRLERSFSSEDAKKVVHRISRAMISTLVGLSLWYLKTYAIKLIDSSFKMKKFFGRVKDATLYKFVKQELDTIKPVPDKNNKNNKENDLKWKDVSTLYGTAPGEVHAIYMTQLIEKLSISELIKSTRTIFEEESEAKAVEVTTEIQQNGDPSYIDAGILKTALEERKLPPRGIDEVTTNKLENTLYSEVLSVFQNDDGTIDEDKIEVSRFKKWMKDADEELRNLAGSLKDSKTAIDELNLISGVLVGIIILIVWSLVMGIMTTEGLVFIVSQLLVWSFMFSDTFKTMFEGIIFNFVAHPLDVGDMCIIGDKKMVVEELGLLSSNFLATEKIKAVIDEEQKIKDDAEEQKKEDEEEQKVYYLNSVLAKLPIINLSKTSRKIEERKIWTRTSK